MLVLIEVVAIFAAVMALMMAFAALVESLATAALKKCAKCQSRDVGVTKQCLNGVVLQDTYACRKCGNVWRHRLYVGG